MKSSSRRKKTGGAERCSVLLNGKNTPVEKGMTLGRLLGKLKIPPNRIACEINGSIARRAEYGTTVLAHKDKLEIIRMIGGG